MSAQNPVLELKSAIDYDTLAENLKHIAEFAVISCDNDGGKGALSQDQREQLKSKIVAALGQDIDKLKGSLTERQKNAFDEAAKILDDIVAAAEHKVTFKPAASSDVVGDNMEDIADFTIEKYEFKKGCSLPQETSDKARAEIVKTLNLRAGVILSRRQRFLNTLIAKARKIAEAGA